ncbi:pyridoxal 5'-phosphate synthase [Alkalilimnicola ehrlichii]|uniref:pyridoxine/pyridoxamine 5'-phosphate oxidase n=1 Tax=Alkalilimnicola ehrlichii TaxID=351052 RepID=UPI002161ACEA|nr:pyridoxal 5'-phosphate synthase [Alkalilimnicola ehrlichii]
MLFWQPLWEQVLVEGAVDDLEPAEADAYWVTRPRLSQLGAWASKQSEPLLSRDELEQRVAGYEEKFSGESVPRPPHWSGYRIVPTLFEFWSARPGRLHDRIRYQIIDGEWVKQLVYP